MGTACRTALSREDALTDMKPIHILTIVYLFLLLSVSIYADTLTTIQINASGDSQPVGWGVGATPPQYTLYQTFQNQWGNVRPYLVSFNITSCGTTCATKLDVCVATIGNATDSSAPNMSNIYGCGETTSGTAGNYIISLYSNTSSNNGFMQPFANYSLYFFPTGSSLSNRNSRVTFGTNGNYADGNVFTGTPPPYTSAPTYDVYMALTFQGLSMPNVTLLKPSSVVTYNTSGVPINISANVSTTSFTKSVQAQITRPDAVVEYVNLLNTSSSLTIWNNTYTIPSIQGLYNITILANDSTGEVNNTVKSSFILDDIFPQFTNVVDNSGSFTGSGTAILNATVTNTNGSVFVSFNSTNYTATSLGANKYQKSLSVGIGNYTYFWYAYGNGSTNHYNSSPILIYPVNATVDITNPVITSVQPLIGSNFTSTGITITINASVTDNTAVDTVIARVTRPDAVVTNLTLTLGTPPVYSSSYLIPNIQGLYQVNVTANDTSNNQAVSQSVTFIVDSVVPSVIMDRPSVNDTNSSFTSPMEIRVNVTDASAISSVKCTVVVQSNGSVTLVPMAFKSSTTYNGTYSGPLTNNTFLFSCNATDVYTNTGFSQTIALTFPLIVPPIINQTATVFTPNTCPADLPGVMLYLGMLFFFLAVVLICLYFRLGIIGIMASIAILLYALFVTGCYPAFGWIFAGVGLGFILYFGLGKYS